MARASTFFVVLLLLFAVCSAARRTPRAQEGVEAPKEVTAEKSEVVEDNSCSGISEDECLMRRTLNAHIDYIYTQNHNP